MISWWYSTTNSKRTPLIWSRMNYLFHFQFSKKSIFAKSPSKSPAPVGTPIRLYY